MLGIPLLEQVSWFIGVLVFGLLVSWLLASWFRGFLVSKFLGLLVSKLLGVLVSKLLRVLVSCFQTFRVSNYKVSKIQRCKKTLNVLLENIVPLLPKKPFHVTDFPKVARIFMICLCPSFPQFSITGFRNL